MFLEGTPLRNFLAKNIITVSSNLHGEEPQKSYVNDPTTRTQKLPMPY